MNAVEVNALSRISKLLRQREEKLAEKKPPDPKSRVVFGRGKRRIGGIEHNGDGRGVRLVHQHYGEFERNDKYEPTLRIRLPKRKTPQQLKVEATEHKHHSAIAMSAVADRVHRLRAQRRRKVK